MHQRTFLLTRRGTVAARIVAVLVVAIAMLPGSGAWAQDEPAQPAGALPPSVVERLANAPGLVPAPVQAGTDSRRTWRPRTWRKCRIAHATPSSATGSRVAS